MNVSNVIKSRYIRRKFIKKSKVNRSRIGNLISFILINIFGLFIAMPIVYAIGNAFKPLDELWIFPPRLFPNNPTFRNFSDLLNLMQSSWVPISRYLFNTVFITVVGTVGHILLASLCAYALSKHEFYGRKFIFSLIILSLMYNSSVTGTSNYLIMVGLHWIDTYLSIIIPAFGSSFGLFLMKQFMDQIPDSYIDAARIDGAKEFKIFWSIVMPSVKPAWLTLIIFSVQGLWNLGSNIYIYKEQLKTFPYAISQIVSAGISRAGIGSAVAVIMMIVPLTIFILTQSNIIETMTNTGVKE